MSGCQHSNCQEVEVGRHINYVSRDMAMDAGDLSLEGQPIDGGPEYALICMDCGEAISE